MAFLADDDEAFEAVLSFVDDFAADDPTPEDAVVDGATADEQLRGDELEMPTIEDMQLQVDGAVIAADETTPGLRRSSRLSKRANGSNNGAVEAAPSATEALRSSRRADNNTKKKMLRKAGVYGDANRARDERKLEIAYLRKKVGQLETELKCVRQRSNDRSIEAVHDGDAETAPSSEEQISSAAGTWEEFAAHQRSKRELAERENVRLKLVLASQIKVAKGLESILLKRARQQVRYTHASIRTGRDEILMVVVILVVQIAECSASIQRRADVACPSGCTLDFQADAADFQGLLQYLDDTYSQVNAVLAANGLAWTETTQHDVQMREGVNGMYLEVFSNKVMPFGLHATAEATWNYFKGSKKHRGTLYAKEAQVRTVRTNVSFSRPIQANLSANV